MHAANARPAAAAGAARHQGNDVPDGGAAGVPGNGAAVDGVELRENVLHALEHNQQHVSSDVQNVTSHLLCLPFGDG